MSEHDTAQAELEAAHAALAEAQTKYAAAQSKAKPPRDPAVIVEEWIEAVNMRLENPPNLRALLAEFRAASTPAPAPATADTSEAKPE